MDDTTKHDAELGSNSHGKVRARLLDITAELTSCDDTLYDMVDTSTLLQGAWNSLRDVPVL